MHQHGKDQLCLNSNCSGINCNSIIINNNNNNSSGGGGGGVGQTQNLNNNSNSSSSGNFTVSSADSSTSATNTSGRFISNTFPLISRSSIKRPLSLQQDRDHLYHHHNSHHHNHNHHHHHSMGKDHRHRDGGSSKSSMVGAMGFRSRAKTIHSTDYYRVSSIYQSDSSCSSTSSSSSATDRRQLFRNMIEFRKKTRKEQLTNNSNNANHHHNHHRSILVEDAEGKKISTTTKTGTTGKISEQILDEEMDDVDDVDDDEIMIDRDVDVEIISSNDDDDDDDELIQSRNNNNNSINGRKDFDGIPPDPNNPFFKLFNKKDDYDHNNNNNNNTNVDNNGQRQQQSSSSTSSSSNDFNFWSRQQQCNSNNNGNNNIINNKNIFESSISNFWSSIDPRSSHHSRYYNQWSTTTQTMPSLTTKLLDETDSSTTTIMPNGKCSSNNNNNFNKKPKENSLSLSLTKTDEEEEEVKENGEAKVTISSVSTSTVATDDVNDDDRSDNNNINDVAIISTTKSGQIHQHIPTEAEKEQFQRSLDSATTLVFHRRSGLPLTSSPAPIRKSGTCFDFDSSLTSVNAIKKALFHKDPDGKDISKRIRSKPSLSPSTATSGLLGNFEESVLNGRLDPASIVHGFTAEIGASGGFCPSHKTFPVTVFFYTLQDTDKGEKMSSPYLGHINLGEKGYHVPRQGTVQVTLFNPNGTVVKMFVVRYDLSDMPPNSRTFLRQRTLFMPSDANEHHIESRKWLRYLIHLRFQSSKSGRIRLHTDIRILVFRKHDLDVATMNGGAPYELRSFVQMPSNPKYSKNIKS